MAQWRATTSQLDGGASYDGLVRDDGDWQSEQATECDEFVGTRGCCGTGHRRPRIDVDLVTDQRGEHEFFEEDFPSLRG